MVIIGVGNPFRKDDAAGLLVARSLRGRVPPGVAVLEQDGEPASLIAAWESADAVIIVDAVSSGAPPGTVHEIDARSVPLDRELFRHSTHSFGVAEAVGLAKALDKMPSIARVYGIEGHDFAAGAEPSPDVLEGVEKAIAAVMRGIAEMGFDPTHE